MRFTFVAFVACTSALGCGCLHNSLGPMLHLDELASASVGPLVQDPVETHLSITASELPMQLLCKVFFRGGAEVNVNLKGPSAACTTRSPVGRQELLCELKAPGKYVLRLAPAAEGKQTQAQVLCFALPPPLRSVAMPCATPEPPAHPSESSATPARTPLDKPRGEPAKADRPRRADPAPTAAPATPPGETRSIALVRGSPPSELRLGCAQPLPAGGKGTLSILDGRRWVSGQFAVLDASTCDVELSGFAGAESLFQHGRTVRMQVK